MNKIGFICLIAFATIGAAHSVIASPNQVLFTNVNIFNGKNNELVYGNVLIENNQIIKISQGLIKAGDDIKIINGNGRTLMPGLIGKDVHQVVRSNYRGIDKELSLLIWLV